MAAILLRRGDHLSGSKNQFDFPSHVVIQIARALCWHSHHPHLPSRGQLLWVITTSTCDNHIIFFLLLILRLLPAALSA